MTEITDSTGAIVKKCVYNSFGEIVQETFRSHKISSAAGTAVL